MHRKRRTLNTQHRTPNKQYGGESSMFDVRCSAFDVVPQRFIGPMRGKKDVEASHAPPNGRQVLDGASPLALLHFAPTRESGRRLLQTAVAPSRRRGSFPGPMRDPEVVELPINPAFGFPALAGPWRLKAGHRTGRTLQTGSWAQSAAV